MARSYYKLYAVEQVIKNLSYEQQKNVYNGNIFLVIEEFKRNDRYVTKGVLLVYDINGEQYDRQVNKAIPNLLDYAEEVACLPKPLREDIGDQGNKIDLCYGKTFRKEKKDGTVEIKHGAYYVGSGKLQKKWAV